MLESPLGAAAEGNAASEQPVGDSLVIFCVDVSGSMCVTTEVGWFAFFDNFLSVYILGARKISFARRGEKSSSAAWRRRTIWLPGSQSKCYLRITTSSQC